MLYQLSGLLILLAFYGCYIGKMICQRRAGIRTDQMGKGKQGSGQRIEIVMKIVTYLTVATEAVSILLNTTVFPAWLRIAGLLLAAAGDAFFMTAVYTMKDSWRAGVSTSDKTGLVSDGIFRISRNPAFVGFDLVYLGLSVTFFNPVLAALSLFSAIMLHLQIVRNEEPFLEKTFGQDYLEYAKHVSRYLGRH